MPAVILTGFQCFSVVSVGYKYAPSHLLGTCRLDPVNLHHPAVYRSGFPAKDESDRLLTEKHLTQDFQIESAGLRSGNDQDAELYFLQQHYGMPTRLLDWTTRPLGALFFAFSKYDERDGAFFAMDAYQLAVHDQNGGVNFRGMATSRYRVFKDAIQPIFQFDKT